MFDIEMSTRLLTIMATQRGHPEIRQGALHQGDQGIRSVSRDQLD